MYPEVAQTTEINLVTAGVMLFLTFTVIKILAENRIKDGMKRNSTEALEVLPADISFKCINA